MNSEAVFKREALEERWERKLHYKDISWACMRKWGHLFIYSSSKYLSANYMPGIRLDAADTGMCKPDTSRTFRASNLWALFQEDGRNVYVNYTSIIKRLEVPWGELRGQHHKAVEGRFVLVLRCFGFKMREPRGWSLAEGRSSEMESVEMPGGGNT